MGNLVLGHCLSQSSGKNTREILHLAELKIHIVCGHVSQHEDYTSNKVQVFDFFGGNWGILWYLRAKHTFLLCLSTPKIRPDFSLLLKLTHGSFWFSACSSFFHQDFYLYAQQLIFQLYIILKLHKFAFMRPFRPSHF